MFSKIIRLTKFPSSFEYFFLKKWALDIFVKNMKAYELGFFSDIAALQKNTLEYVSNVVQANTVKSSVVRTLFSRNIRLTKFLSSYKSILFANNGRYMF